jgi:hypothetical protein
MGQWWFSGSVSTEEFIGQFVPSGQNIAFELRYDAVANTVTFLYDRDIEDSDEGITLGPFPFLGNYQETHEVFITVGASEQGRANGIIDLWSTTPISNVQGDFNGNEVLDAADIDALSAQVRAGANDSLYDLNADAAVDDLDRQFWVHDLKQTFFGDADLDGSFDSADLVQVLAFGEYEDKVKLNSTWLTGDWNGDGDFTSGDLIVALADGGYEAVQDAAAVPEPAGGVFAMAAAALVMTRRRKRAETHRA